MSVSVVQRLFAFVGSVWSLILTLVRSLLALFSFRRRASDTFTLPTVHRTPKDALARAHPRLRPILLTPRALAPDPHRTRSATSTLCPIQAQPRTSPKLGPTDAELGLSAAVPPAASACREGTPDTSLGTSVYVSPLTPPDRCYLAPLPSATDCPYTKPWPANVALDRSKRFSGSPLRESTNMDSALPEPMLAPMGPPPPGHCPVQIWSSTPCNDDGLVPDPVLSPFHLHKDPSPALVNISNALISRSQSSFQPYDDTSHSFTSSDASPFVNRPDGTLQRLGATRERRRAPARVARSKNHPYPQFHHPDAYAYAWRRHGARLPGKPNRTHAPRSHSYVDPPASEWYDADAYAPSPVSALSPPGCGTATDSDSEDEMPLGRLRERLARRNAAVGASVELGVPFDANATVMSPRTRRMSEGCLLAIAESTPTRIGVGARSGRHVLSLALDGGAYSSKDWLEALSLRFSSEQRGALAPELEPSVDVGALRG
ncbi:hypothetical protein HD554DRAFT_2173973 [Boletus coccyginus]|nr:hypothetical protein HD554DRAFT_2173973 [Boletus coccyginus]